MTVSKNPFKRDEADPRWRAVEIRREYEQRGYVVEKNGVFDPKTGKNVLKRENDEGARLKR